MGVNIISIGRGEVYMSVGGIYVCRGREGGIYKQARGDQNIVYICVYWQLKSK